MDLDLQTLDMPVAVACGLCGRSLLVEHQVNRSVGVCDDCKFLLLEDFGTPLRTTRRRSINGGADSPDNFSREFSQLINQARLIEPEVDDILGESDSRTTPSGSRRWRPRIYSDTESDGFNSDSFYGEGESNISTDAYRVYLGDSDSISFSSYEGDSAASVDGHTYFDTDVFVQSMERSDIGSDSDIDPMHAGAVHWNSDVDENIFRPHYGERSRADSYEFEGMIHQRINEVRELHMSMEEFDEAPHSSNPDYLDAREFDEFLENLAENDSSRRGAPPAALSSIGNLPLVVISDEHVKSDGLACAICKDLLMIGTQVNQLPCYHLYHPSCILPWLSTRNSCPLCRYELPTDDTEYELGKRNANHRMVISEIQEDRDDSSSVNSETPIASRMEDEDVGPTAGISHRRGWLFFAATPIVSLAGIVFVLWLGNVNSNPPRGTTEQRNLHALSSQPIQTPGLCPHNQRVKRWWWWWF